MPRDLRVVDYGVESTSSTFINEGVCSSNEKVGHMAALFDGHSITKAPDV